MSNLLTNETFKNLVDMINEAIETNSTIGLELSTPNVNINNVVEPAEFTYTGSEIILKSNDWFHMEIKVSDDIHIGYDEVEDIFCLSQGDVYYYFDR